MVKIIGVLLILSSLLALAAGAFIDSKYGEKSQASAQLFITGNVVSNIISHPDVDLSALDYASGIAFSYSAFSLIIGVMFLARV